MVKPCCSKVLTNALPWIAERLRNSARCSVEVKSSGPFATGHKASNGWILATALAREVASGTGVKSLRPMFLSEAFEVFFAAKTAGSKSVTRSSRLR